MIAFRSGKMPHVGAAPDLLVEPFVGVIRPDLLGERGEGEDVLAGVAARTA
jgi:hypothetical protein